MKKQQAGEHSLLRGRMSETILKVDGIGKESKGESCDRQSRRGAAAAHRPCEQGCELD